jgi:hypothetical protein
MFIGWQRGSAFQAKFRFDAVSFRSAIRAFFHKVLLSIYFIIEKPFQSGIYYNAFFGDLYGMFYEKDAEKRTPERIPKLHTRAKIQYGQDSGKLIIVQRPV